MKRLIGGLLTVAVVAVGMTTNAFAATSDFTFTSAHADYYLGADKEGRSTLKTVETFTTDSDQSFTRVIPENYSGHPTSLAIVSVVDGSGRSLNYSTSENGHNTVLKIDGVAKTYIITYTQRDVTVYNAKTKQHEFSRDVTGDQLRQSIEQANVTVYSDKNISPTLNKSVSCQVGTTACSASEQGTEATMSASNIQPGQSMSIVVGYTAGTFRAYQAAPWWQLSTKTILEIVMLVLVVLAAVALWFSARQKRNRTKK